MMDTERDDYAQLVADRIELEFLEKLRAFMATAVPLDDIARVQAEHEARAAENARPMRLMQGEGAPIVAQMGAREPVRRAA